MKQHKKKQQQEERLQATRREAIENLTYSELCALTAKAQEGLHTSTLDAIEDSRDSLETRLRNLALNVGAVQENFREAKVYADKFGFVEFILGIGVGIGVTYFFTAAILPKVS